MLYNRLPIVKFRAKKLIMKDKGQPCEQGETAARSGCIPASGDGHKKPASTGQGNKANTKTTLTTVGFNDPELTKLRKDAENFPKGPRRDEALHSLNPSKWDNVILQKDDNGKLVGVAQLWRDSDEAQTEGVPEGPFLRLRNMATSRSGLGDSLFDAVKEQAIAKKAGLYLSSLEGSEAFYEKHGMKRAVGSTYFLTYEDLLSSKSDNSEDSTMHKTMCDVAMHQQLYSRLPIVRKQPTAKQVVLKALDNVIAKEGRWITLNGGSEDGAGTHVYVSNGKITAGPSSLEGKPLSQLSGKKLKTPKKPDSDKSLKSR